MLCVIRGTIYIEYIPQVATHEQGCQIFLDRGVCPLFYPRSTNPKAKIFPLLIPLYISYIYTHVSNIVIVRKQKV